MVFLDSAGNELIAGDIVRMYHFTGTRRRKHYMYKRFVGYMIERSGAVAAKYQSLDDESHFFTDVDNKLKDNIVVVQRARFLKNDLKKNPKLRD